MVYIRPTWHIVDARLSFVFFFSLFEGEIMRLTKVPRCELHNSILISTKRAVEFALEAGIHQVRALASKDAKRFYSILSLLFSLSLSLSFLFVSPTNPHTQNSTKTQSQTPILHHQNYPQKIDTTTHHHHNQYLSQNQTHFDPKKKKKKNLNHHPHSPPPPPSTKKLNHLATTKTTIWHKPTSTDPNSQAITKTHHQNQQASTKTLKTSKQSPKRTTKTSKHHPNTYPKWPIQTPPNDWPKLQPQPLSTQTPIYAITETHCLKSQGSWGRVMREENFEDWERLREKCREFRGKKV